MRYFENPSQFQNIDLSCDPQNEEEVKEYMDNIGIEYRFGCYSEKNPEVCFMLAEYLETFKRDYENAAKVFRSACDDYGHGRACMKYASYRFVGRGQSGTTASSTDALSYFEKGCKLGDADSCMCAGQLLLSDEIKTSNAEQQVRKGVDHLTKGCDLNNGDACLDLFDTYITGIKRPEVSAESTATKGSADSKPSTTEAKYIIPKDTKKAFSAVYKSCELKNWIACGNLSQMYARGDGTAKDTEKAEKYKKIAIELRGGF